MSEFIEIGKSVYRISDVQRIRPYEGRTIVDFVNYGADTLNEPYESVRDKLLGNTAKTDLRAAFACQVVQHLRDKGLNEASVMVAAFYNSMMLSETEGAG